ncbi:hypothetical protein PoB_004186800 [Plakobranchus ocellatus]|uniref:Uncharacterized protein n=1 Tax=Plakobranchus ocellatus TaxID=259542 RepID=A0AAV4B872_9GAST|nr:hypothetical protein PoB_004186800 [Plakobranchus ocellatus]
MPGGANKNLFQDTNDGMNGEEEEEEEPGPLLTTKNNLFATPMTTPQRYANTYINLVIVDKDGPDYHPRTPGSSRLSCLR